MEYGPLCLSEKVQTLFAFFPDRLRKNFGLKTGSVSKSPGRSRWHALPH